jgi:predicted ATPase
MITKLRRTQPNMQALLGSAAVIGNQFELGLLAELRAHSTQETFALLTGAAQENFVIPLDKEYEELGDSAFKGMVLSQADNVKEDLFSYVWDAKSDENDKTDKRNSDGTDELSDAVFDKRTKKNDKGEAKSNEGEGVLLNPLFRFGHDRIQQAAFCLLGEEEVKRTHRGIAECLLMRYHTTKSKNEKDGNKHLDERILNIVNHLNKGYFF